MGPIWTATVSGGTTIAATRNAARRILVGLVVLFVAPLVLIPAAAAQSPNGKGAERRVSGLVRADYDPVNGLRVTSPDGLVDLTAPAGAVGEVTTFSHTGIVPPTGGRTPRLARAFRLEAATIRDNRPVTHFDRPLRLVARYDDADLAALRAPASALRLFYQTVEGTWQLVPSSVDPTTRTVSADVDHFTVFGVGVDRCALACDDFDRADASSLGSAVVGGGWRLRPRDTTVFGLCGGLACATTATGDGAYAAVDATTADQSLQVTIQEPTGGVGAAGGVLRARPGWERFLVVEVTAAGQLILWRYDGTWTALDSVNIALAAGSRHTLGASANGATVIVTWDGAELLSARDSVDATGTYAGLYIGTQGAASGRPTLDDVTITASNTLAPAPTAVVAACAAAGTGATDAFKRTAPAGSLGCADSGGQWENATDAAWTICDDVAACALAPAGGSSWTRLSTGLIAQRVSATVAPRPAGAVGQAGVLVGVTPDWNANLLYVGIDPAGVVEVWTIVNGAWSSAALASAATGKGATAARTLEARSAGGSLVVLVDGAQVLGPVPVPVPPANGTMAGLYADTAGSVESWPRFTAFSVAPSP